MQWVAPSAETIVAAAAVLALVWAVLFTAFSTVNRYRGKSRRRTVDYANVGTLVIVMGGLIRSCS